VLFADVKGSTAMVAGKDPEEARRLLDPTLQRMIDAVRRYGGTVNQVMGDGIMALFGAPISYEDHALRACRAALDMQAGADGIWTDVPSGILIRVGVNSGEVVVRSISSDVHIDYTAVGEVTHLASRMEQLARPGSVMITGQTMRLVRRAVEATSLGPLPVAGLPEPVEVHELKRVLLGSEILSTEDAVDGVRFVGRDEERAALRAALDLAESGNGQMIVLVGEAGVGKTRLVKELLRSVEPERWRVLTTTCNLRGSSGGHTPIASLLMQFFDVSTDWSPDAVLDRVRGSLSSLDSGLADHGAAIAALLGVVPAGALLTRLDPGQRRQAILDSLQLVVQTQCRRTPLLIFVDDLHLIDEDSLWLLDALIEGLPGARLMLLATSRPERLSEWGHELYMRQMPVGPLPAQRAEELVDALLGNDASLAALRVDLLGRTEGNPLFIEECVAALAEDGSIVGSRGAYRPGSSSETVRVPPTIQAILAARIDRMEPQDALLLQAASVVGRSAAIALLLGVSNVSDQQLQLSLGRLHEGGFLHPDLTRGGDDYSFKHALTQEVAYASLMRERRRDLHARVFGFLEATYGERCDDHAEELAHHALRGALSLQGIRYLRTAGESAARRSAHFEAIRFFKQAVAELARFPDRFDTQAMALELRLALGPELRTVNGGWSPEVEACYKPALALCDHVEAASPRFMAQFGLWSCYSTRGDYARAREAAGNLQEISRRAPGHLQLEARHALWSTAVASGRPAEADEHLKAGESLAGASDTSWWKYGSHDPSTCRLQMAGLAAWLRGEFNQARTLATKAIQCAKQTGHSYTTVMALYIAAVIHYHCGDHGGAKLRATNASRLGRFHGVKSWPEHASIVLARLSFLEGRSKEGIDLLEANLPGALEAGWPWTATVSVGIAAELYLAAHRPEDGLKLLESLPLSQYEGLYGPELLKVRAKLLLEGIGGSAEAAEHLLRQALQLAKDRGMKALELRAAMTLAYYLASRDRREAHRALAIVDTFKGDLDVSDVRTGRALREWLA